MKKSARNPLLRFVCFLLGIVMFLCAIYATTVLDLRMLVSKNGISQILRETLSSVVPSPIRLTLTAGDLPSASKDQSEQDSPLADWLYGQMQDIFDGNAPFTKDQVDQFVEESNLRDFIAENFSGAVDDFYAQQGTVIEKEDVLQLINENAALLEQITGFVVTDEMKQQAIGMIEDSGMLEELAEKGLHGIILESMGEADDPSSDGQTPGASTGKQEPSMMKILDTIRQATSYTAVAIAAGAFLVLAVIYFFAAQMHWGRTLTGCGIPLLLTGLIFIPGTVVCLAAPQTLMDFFSGDPIVPTVINLFFRITAPVNCAVFGAGLVMIVAGIVLNVRAKKQAAV